MEITKHLFINFSIIIILLSFSFIYLEKVSKTTISKSSIFIVFLLLLWICVHFSYQPVSFARFDLRIIPIVIGSLYFGIGLFLAPCAIIIRSFYGIDTGFYMTAALYIPFTVLIWYLSPWFWKQLPMRRVLIAIIIGAVLGVLHLLGLSFFNTNTYWLDAWAAYLIIPPIGLGIISYGIEFIKNSAEMRLHLIKAEKLKAIEQMGAAISHEIRNPLTAASGFVQLLEDDYLPRQKRKEYLAIVKDELNSAERVIQDYLTFAKPSLESFEELNVKSELKQIINLLQPLANQNSVEISTDFSVIGFIKGDQQKFRQCFINVLKNSIEAMPNGGYLFISTDFLHDSISITVKDTGIGMTKEQLERLGEPFYSTKGKNGTGLGMMVVYSIVRAMNGSVWAESELDVGTTFHFNFPAFTSIMANQHAQIRTGHS